ncbi:acetoacetyl-CoA synthetase [Trichonephila clavipes]|nr:acetoacetyl-CoA synthetase [Trichonephila clavipes]
MQTVLIDDVLEILCHVPSMARVPLVRHPCPRQSPRSLWVILHHQNIKAPLENSNPSNTNFEHLKAITIGGSPVKTENFKYIQSIVKENVVIAGLYGATETFGPFSGCDFNLPIYAPEIQVPSLGTKAQCVDSNGETFYITHF